MSEDHYYTASFTNCKREDRDYFKAKSCILAISVGQSPHEDEKFRATLSIVNSYFKKCIIAVNDTLQRHTLSLYHPEKSESELFEYAYQLGNEWIDRNEKIVKEELRIPYQFKRWDSWFGNDRYFKDIKTVNELYINDRGYKKVIDDVVQTFVDRLSNRTEVISLGRAGDVSRVYLLEECAAMLQWFDEGVDYDLYPSVRNDGISETFRLLESEKDKCLLRPIGIKFKRCSGVRPVVDLDQLAMTNLLKILPGHIYWKDSHGAFVGCNTLQAKGFGFKKIKSIIGKSDFDILDYDIAMKIRHNDIKVIESGTTSIVEEATVVNGVQSVYISNKTPIKDSNGTVVGILGMSIDITEQKALEKQLKQKTQELQQALSVKTEFLNNISHEIRAPITGFSVAADNLMNSWHALSESQKYEMVKVISRSAERIKNLSMHLIDAVKLKEGKSVLNFQRLNFSKFIQDFIDEARTLYAKEKNITILFNETRDFYVNGDYEALGQVLRNIVTNSIKFSPQGSSISVKINAESSRIKVSIIDQGVGVAEEDLVNIFNQFYQSSRTKTGAGGVGLGLSITKQIIEAHDGKIWAENTLQGGCRINFELNTLENNIQTEVCCDTNKRVLMIDDDELVISSIGLSFISRGFDVAAAFNGSEGIKMIENGEFDFVLLDMMMPGISGFEVLEVIKVRWPNLKVVVHSGMISVEDIERIKALGVHGFSKKPCKVEDLLAHFV